MKHATSIVLALFGLAAVAPAQLRIEGNLGRHVQVSAELGARTVARHDDHGGGRHGDRGRRDDHRGRRDDHRHRGRGRDDRHDRHGHHDHHAHGRWETVRERVRVPGYWREEYVPARYGWIVDDCGVRVWGVVAPACTHRVWVPPCYEYRTRRVFVRC